MSRLGIQTSSQKTCYRSSSPKKRSSGGIEPCRILSPMYAVIPERIGNYNLTLEQDDKYVIDGQYEMYEGIKFNGVVLDVSAQQVKFFATADGRRTDRADYRRGNARCS